MKDYFCSIEWSICVEAENEKEAIKQAWEDFEDTGDKSMKAEEN